MCEKNQILSYIKCVYFYFNVSVYSWEPQRLFYWKRILPSHRHFLWWAQLKNGTSSWGGEGFPDPTQCWLTGKVFGLGVGSSDVEVQLVKIRRSGELPHLSPDAQQHLKVSCVMKSKLIMVALNLACSYSITCSSQPALLCQWLYYFLNLCVESYLTPGQWQPLTNH